MGRQLGTPTWDANLGRQYTHKYTQYTTWDANLGRHIHTNTHKYTQNYTEYTETTQNIQTLHTKYTILHTITQNTHRIHKIHTEYIQIHTNIHNHGWVTMKVTINMYIYIYIQTFQSFSMKLPSYTDIAQLQKQIHNEYTKLHTTL